MPYANPDELKRRMSPRYYDELYPADEGGEQLAEDDLASASAAVDAKAGVRYALPVTAASAVSLLKAWTLTLAEEFAWGRSARDKVPEVLKKRLEAARADLDALAKGGLCLPGAAERKQGAGAALTQSAPAHFDGPSMGRW